MNHFISRRGEHVGHSDEDPFRAQHTNIAYPLERESAERSTRSRAKREIVPRISAAGKIVDA